MSGLSRVAALVDQLQLLFCQLFRPKGGIEFAFELFIPLAELRDRILT